MANWQVLVSALIGAATIGVGIWQFREDSEMRADTARLEARKPFLEKQMELCFSASEAAATLATTTDPKRWRASKETFWTLYWGPLSIVERPLAAGEIGAVEGHMVEFGNKLKPLQNDPTLPLSELERSSLDLAHACRDLIFDSWEIEVPPRVEAPER
jgi:hypothetical protein